MKILVNITIPVGIESKQITESAIKKIEKGDTSPVEDVLNAVKYYDGYTIESIYSEDGKKLMEW